ncbi:hypothetical protein [uncultured Kordia sp.]|uniref:hypothetical protein n=1 Tax=uncultured Kordia sp. TaxID=507699 RepID=UPI00261A43AF|nr:hypothetical protein [uncultured Kordia sp.]
MENNNLNADKKSKHDLDNLSNEKIKNAYEFQFKNTDWTFYTEREFIETLLANRFNFLIVIYSLFITAFATIEGKENKLIILILGLVITILISITIYRVYTKLMINLKILYKLGDNHVFPIIKKELEGKRRNIGNVNQYIAIVIPLLFIISFILGITFIAFNYWKV